MISIGSEGADDSAPSLFCARWGARIEPDKLFSLLILQIGDSNLGTLVVDAI